MGIDIAAWRRWSAAMSMLFYYRYPRPGILCKRMPWGILASAPFPVPPSIPDLLIVAGQRL